MGKIKKKIEENKLNKYVFLIIITMAIIFAMYFILSNFMMVVDWSWGHISNLLSAISPLIIGLVLAYLIDPLVSTIDGKIMVKLIRNSDDPLKNEKKIKKRRILSVVCSYLLIVVIALGLVYFFTAMVIGQLIIGSIQDLIEAAIQYVQVNEQKFSTWINQVQTKYFEDTKLINVFNMVVDWVQDNISVSSIVGGVVSFGGSIFNFVIGLIISIYLVADKAFFSKIGREIIRLSLRPQRAEKLEGTLVEVNGVVKSFVKGVFIDAIIVAILSSIGLSILGLEFGVFVGIFAGVCNVIPYFGPILGMIPAFFIGAFTESPVTGLIAVGILLLVQQIDCNLIYPRVVGQSTGLHPLFVLLAVSILGAYGGLVGMILAVPIAGVLQIFIRRGITKLEAKAKDVEDISEVLNENFEENAE